MPKSLPKLIISIGLCLGVGFLGSFFTNSSSVTGLTWYASLTKPSFSPPNWLFGPVWTVLYVLMGISLYLILISDRVGIVRGKAITIFGIQLFLNFIWSIIFFGYKNPELALVDIIFLWLLIILTIKSFRKLNKLAANLLVPYLLWVSFAFFLNLVIVLIN